MIEHEKDRKALHHFLTMALVNATLLLLAILKEPLLFTLTIVISLYGLYLNGRIIRDIKTGVFQEAMKEAGRG